MNHIVLICAFHQLNFVKEQLNIYDTDEDFHVYIHWDLKTYNNDIEFQLRMHPSVKGVYSKYTVNWGGRNLLEAMIMLCKAALKAEAVENKSIFHMISDSDIVIRPLNEVKSYFDKHADTGFMEYFTLPSDRWKSGGLDRLIFKHPLDRLNIRLNEHYCIYNRYLTLQKRSHFKRQLPKVQFYGGSCWWSLPKYIVQYFVEHIDDNGLFERMKDVFGPEEILPQTIIMNSSYSEQIKETNLRYICWDYCRRGAPAMLEAYDLPMMQHSGAIWARKVHGGKCKEVIAYYKWFLKLPLFNYELTDCILHSLVGYLMKNSINCPILGLMDGKMGVIVFITCYNAIKKNAAITEFTNIMLDEILEKSKTLSHSDFNNGLLGIAYSLKWLIKFGYAKGREDQINQYLKVFDKHFYKTINNCTYRILLSDDFWGKYYNFVMYLELDGIQRDVTSRYAAAYFAKQYRDAVDGKGKQSIGFSGLSGKGFYLLQSQYPIKIHSFFSENNS